MGREMGEVVPVPLRASSGSDPSNCGKASADINEVPASVGQDLRKARRHRDKSLVEVSSALKISPDYLTALEMGRFEDLPARVYAVGYVRSYAAYLGLDPASLVARFKSEMASAGITEPAFNASRLFLEELGPEDTAVAPTNAKPATIRLSSWS